MHLHLACAVLEALCQHNLFSCFLSLALCRYTGKLTTVINEYDDLEKPSKPGSLSTKNHNVGNFAPPPPPLKKNTLESRDKQGPAVARVEEDDIFIGDGVDYEVPSKDMSQSPISEDMEESPRNKDGPSYFNEPVYGPVPPSNPSQDWNQAVSSLVMVVRLGLAILVS